MRKWQELIVPEQLVFVEMSHLPTIFTTLSLTLFLLVPRNIMLFSFPKRFPVVASRLPYSILSFLAASISFGILFWILQFTLAPSLLDSAVPSLPSTFQINALSSGGADPRWHAPAKSDINDLARALDGDGPMARKVVPKTSAGASEQPEGWQYGEYNYCNMPHVRTEEYVRKEENEWELLYVEVIQRRKCILLCTTKGILRR